MKKLITALLCVAVISCGTLSINTPGIAAVAYAAESSNGMVTENTILKNYNGTDLNIVIPEGITEIADKCFYNTNIESVSFPSTLEVIGSQAFWSTHLKEVRIPASVKTIKYGAFAKIKRLEKLVIEDKNQYPVIGPCAFEDCVKLSSVMLPKRASIANGAFLNTEYGGSDERNEWYVTNGYVKNRPSDMREKKLLVHISDNRKSVSIRINENRIKFTDAEPFIDNSNRTMAPVRAVTEALGAEVSYNADLRMVTIRLGKDTVTLTIGSRIMNSSGNDVLMDTEAKLINDRVFIPVRFIAESFGYECGTI